MEQPRCVLEDVKKVTGLYGSEAEFLAAADQYLILIEANKSRGMKEAEINTALSVLRVAAIRQNGSWKSAFRWFDPKEELRPQKKNRFELAVIKILGTRR